MKKNLMKRIVAMITAAVMLFSLAAFAACSKKQDDTEIRIAALKGPTGMGMVKLADKQNYPNYTVSIEASPDALNPRIISGEVDVAAVPVNLAIRALQQAGWRYIGACSQHARCSLCC